jgi:hypothetical protein
MSDPYAGHTWSPGPPPPPVDLDSVLEELAALEDGDCVLEQEGVCDCGGCAEFAVLCELFPPPRPVTDVHAPRYL